MPKGALAPVARINELREQGLSHKGIARALEREGLGLWHPSTINKACSRRRRNAPPIDKEFARTLRAAGLTWWKVWILYLASGREAASWKVVRRACLEGTTRQERKEG